MYNKIVISYLVFLLGSFTLSSASFADKTEIENTIDEIFARDYINGTIRVSIANEFVIHKSNGLAHPGNNIKYTNDSAFGIGSITKSFTAAAIMKLVDAGKLSVEDKLVDIVPNSPDIWKHITVHQLLTHTSGLKDYLNGSTKYLFMNFENFHSEKEIFEIVKKMPLANTVGKFKYSNSGYFLLGQIINVKSGINWQKYIEKEIFKPLGLTNTHLGYYDYGPFHRQKIIKKRVGRLSEVYGDSTTEHYGLNPSFSNAAGAIITTARDLEKWIKGLYYGDLLTEGSKKLVFSPHIKVSEQSNTNYGYGWMISEIGGKEIISHGGSTFMELSYLFFNPADNLVYVSNNNLAEFKMTNYFNKYWLHFAKILEAKLGKTPWFPPIIKPKKFKHSEIKSVIGKYYSKELELSGEVKFYNGNITIYLYRGNSPWYLNMFSSENAMDWVGYKDVTTLKFEKKDKAQNLIFQIENQTVVTMEKISSTSLSEEETKLIEDQIMMKNFKIGPIFPDREFSKILN